MLVGSDLHTFLLYFTYPKLFVVLVLGFVMAWFGTLDWHGRSGGHILFKCDGSIYLWVFIGILGEYWLFFCLIDLWDLVLFDCFFPK